MLCARGFIRKTGFVVCLMAVGMLVATASASAFAPDDDHDKGPVQTGYVVITPWNAATGTANPNAKGLVVFETFGEHKGGSTTQAGILPSEMTTSALFFVNASGRLSRNLGVAIANPGGTPAVVTLTLRGADGSKIAEKIVTVEKFAQTARYVTELFAGQPSVPQDLEGTLLVTSSQPIAVVGLRFRGENFSTLPATNLTPPPVLNVPVITLGSGSSAPKVGGPGAIILAHYAVGGGWASEIVLANSDLANDLTVRVDLFKPDGTPLAAELNSVTSSSFVVTIAKGGVKTLAPRNRDGDSDF